MVRRSDRPEAAAGMACGSAGRAMSGVGSGATIRHVGCRTMSLATGAGGSGSGRAAAAARAAAARAAAARSWSAGAASGSAARAATAATAVAGISARPGSGSRSDGSGAATTLRLGATAATGSRARSRPTGLRLRDDLGPGRDDRFGLSDHLGLGSGDGLGLGDDLRLGRTTGSARRRLGSGDDRLASASDLRLGRSDHLGLGGDFGLGHHSGGRRHGSGLVAFVCVQLGIEVLARAEPAPKGGGTTGRLAGRGAPSAGSAVTASAAIAAAATSPGRHARPRRAIRAPRVRPRPPRPPPHRPRPAPRPPAPATTGSATTGSTTAASTAASGSTDDVDGFRLGDRFDRWRHLDRGSTALGIPVRVASRAATSTWSSESRSAAASRLGEVEAIERGGVRVTAVRAVDSPRIRDERGRGRRGRLLELRERGFRSRRAAQAAGFRLVPAVGAGVLPAGHAEGERLVEGVELVCRDLALGLAPGGGHRLVHRGVVGQDEVLEAARQGSDARQTLSSTVRFERIAGAAAFAEGFGQDLGHRLPGCRACVARERPDRPSGSRV